jgi:hypothetical protein
MSVNRPIPVLSALLAAAVVSACVGAGQQAQTLSLPTLPSVGSIPEGAPDATQATPVAVDQPIGSATELYSRVARGAMACWFATNGPLKKDFIFHATADAPSRGGKAEIVIHQRDPTQPNPRGAKAFLVEIEPTGESTAAIKTENLKMTDAFAVAMTDDVGRWSKGDQGCAGASTAVGWAPAPPDAAPAAAKPKVKKGKLKAAQSKPAAQP